MRIRSFTSVPWVVAWVCMVLGCESADVAPSGSADADGAGRQRILASPAGPGSGEPNLSLAGDTILMSWLEPATEGHALRFSRLIGDRWEEPQTVVSRTEMFVNWADFPSVIQLPDGVLAAHWLQYSGPGTYSYDVWVSTSGDGGLTWSDPSRPHSDGTATEHGFVSLFATPGDQGLSAAWLDGRAYADTTAEQPFMALRAASLGPHGWTDPVVLDDRTCDCCQTSAARIPNGVIVAYRGRTEQEIRDIRVVRFAQGRWSQPTTVYHDGWEIPACPVNGPSIAARGDTVAVAWFTAADDTPRVRLAFSYDGGSTFARPTNVAGRGVLGRVSVSMVDGGGAMVTYLAQLEAGAGVLTRYIMLPDGRGLAPVLLGESTAERSSGFPVAVKRGSDLVAAWTVPADTRTIRIVAVRLFR